MIPVCFERRGLTQVDDNLGSSQLGIELDLRVEVRNLELRLVEGVERVRAARSGAQQRVLERALCDAVPRSRRLMWDWGEHRHPQTRMPFRECSDRLRSPPPDDQRIDHDDDQRDVGDLPRRIRHRA